MTQYDVHNSLGSTHVLTTCDCGAAYVVGIVAMTTTAGLQTKVHDVKSFGKVGLSVYVCTHVCIAVCMFYILYVCV